MSLSEDSRARASGNSTLGDNGYDDDKQKATSTAKCPSCGAELIWSPADRCLKCDFCGSKQEIDLQRFAEEIDFAEMLGKSNNSWAEETHMFRCSNCGAKEILAKKEISKKCSFCGTPNVVEVAELAGLKPNAVVPFLIDKDNAFRRVKAWAMKKLYAPRDFKRNVTPNEIKGTYSPAFTFDTNTMSNYSGRLGEYYYVTVTRNGKPDRQRRTRYFYIDGNYERVFDDVLVHAGSSIGQNSYAKLSPFPTNGSQEYKEDYLRGFSASQYSKDGEQCWTEARHTIEERIRREILSQYTYDVVDSLNVYTSCLDIKYKYILLPIYVGHFNWKKKLYNFFVNGYNGIIAGKTPISALKVAITALIGAAALAGLGLLGYNLGLFNFFLW